jgi:hypothetical protein
VMKWDRCAFVDVSLQESVWLKGWN